MAHSAPDPEDLTLVAGWKVGDESAFNRLYEKYNPLVRGIAYNIVGSNHADDISQITWMKAFEKLGSYNQFAPFKSWVCTISHNTAVDYLKSLSRKRAYNFSSLSEDENDKMMEYAARENSEERAEIETRSAKAMRLMDTLPAEEKRIFEERFVNGRKYREIATILNTPSATIRAKIYRIKQKLA